MNQLEKPVKGDAIAVMHTTEGDIRLRLFLDRTPLAAQNFITHAKNGYYEGVIFHRVIDGFMIQGGDPTGTGRGGESIWGHDFENEPDAELRHYRGALSMANAGPDTNGSQFFIVQAREISPDVLSRMESLREHGFPREVIERYRAVGGTPHLDFHHTVFGQVYAGMETVDAVASAAVDRNDRPVKDIYITGIDIAVQE